jgi:AraC-like DNA-binding protein
VATLGRLAGALAGLCWPGMAARGQEAGKLVAERASARDRVAMRLVWPILRAAESEGVDTAGLLRRARLGVPSAGMDLASCEEYVTLGQYLRLWEAALAEVPRPGFPLVAATVTGPESLGVVGFACITSRTLAEAFHRACRYHVLCTANSRWQREERPAGTCALLFEQEGPAGPARDAAVEFSLAELLNQARALSRMPMTPIETRFQHRRPAGGDDAYRAYFGDNLSWQAARNPGSAPDAEGVGWGVLIMNAEALEQTSPKGDPQMFALFDKQAEALLAKVPAEVTTSDLVRREIVAALPSGTPALADVARSLATSERTLRRRLADEQTSFQALLESCRSTLAGRYLERRDLALSEIAFLLGFSEPSPFYRAFRRWFGQSPEQYRQQAASIS